MNCLCCTIRGQDTSNCDEVIITITHPFINNYGEKYLVVGQHQRGDTLFLQCVKKQDGQIATFPASITDFPTRPGQVPIDMDVKSFFTIQGLNEAAFILDNSLHVST